MTKAKDTVPASKMDANLNYMKIKALEFFRNYLSHYKGSILSSTVFESFLSCADTAAIKSILGGTKQCARHGDTPEEKIVYLWNSSIDHEPVRTRLINAFDHIIETNKPEDCPLAAKIEEVRKSFGLDQLETDFLLAGYLRQMGFLHFPESIRHAPNNFIDKIYKLAYCLNVSADEIQHALVSSGNLHRLGFVNGDFQYTGSLNYFFLGVNEVSVCSSFYYHDDYKEVLPWNCFSTLAEKHGEALKKMLAATTSEQSMNILLYGKPGTGKSSFARALAKETGKKCYWIAQQQLKKEDGTNDASSNGRFAALLMCCRRIKHKNSIIIIDEADQMLCRDKGQLNDMLDGIQVPMIWIANVPACLLSPSSRRRFDYSIYFDDMDEKQRLQVWKYAVEEHHLSSLVDENMMKDFSCRYATNAGGISLVAKNLRTICNSKENTADAVKQLMQQHCELMDVANKDNPDDKSLFIQPARDYTLEGLNIQSGIKLDRLIAAVKKFRTSSGNDVDQPRMNILLSGVPGAGKTEFVKYLGQTLNTKVVVKMGSDLLDMFVGNTEKMIRDAFAEAQHQHAILFMDEIDGMLQTRENASHSWEVSQVNELLHQMENYNGIFIGATNFNKRLDPAVIRRFTFKLEFGYLENAGKKHFFEHMFRTTLSAGECARLEKIANLTPGDFRTVRQGLYYLDETEVTNDERLTMLEAESQAKQGKTSAAEQGSRTRIGFSKYQMVKKD